jgi:hypothetical protein
VEDEQLHVQATDQRATKGSDAISMAADRADGQMEAKPTAAKKNAAPSSVSAHDQ